MDVGQGDAILIEQGSTQILIDGGPSGQKIMEKLGGHVPFWDRNIEILIATHPDQDHLSGLIDVMGKYKVSEIIDNGTASDSQVYKKFKETIQNRNITEIDGRAGRRIKLQDGAELEIFNLEDAQGGDVSRDTNSGSLIARLSYGKDNFLFTGDLPSEKEPALIRHFALVDSRILKVAHHGSKYSTSVEFLEAVNPEVAVISVGKNNRYGHPAQEVLDRLNERKIKILRTDEIGDIEYYCQNTEEKCFLNQR